MFIVSVQQQWRKMKSSTSVLYVMYVQSSRSCTGVRVFYFETIVCPIRVGYLMQHV